MKQVPILIASNSCPKCVEAIRLMNEANLPHEVRVVPEDSEARQVAIKCKVVSAGEYMYLPDNLEEVFTVEHYLEKGSQVMDNDNS